MRARSLYGGNYVEIEQAMLPEIEGVVPDVFRIQTGLHSLDSALGFGGDRGFPLRTVVELYGREHVGKSSVAYYLGGAIRPDGKVGIVDTEGSLDPQYLRIAFGQAGFRGTIKVTDFIKQVKGEDVGRYHNEQVTELADYLINPEYNAIILDSVSMYRSKQETEGEIGDANMGKRAFNVGQWSRRCASHLMVYHNPPKTALMVNHVFVGMGSTRGHYTPGGRVKGHAANFRLYMWREETFDDGSFLANVKVEKLRWGGVRRDQQGLVYIIPGLGVSPEMTAIFDAKNLGLVKRGTHIKYLIMKDGKETWKSAGYLKKLREAAKEGNKKPFKPILKLLEDYKEDG
jgi:RecA/RadA recombinase